VQLGLKKVPIVRVYLPGQGEAYQEYDLATYAWR
jgi:hypothetical protein